MEGAAGLREPLRYAVPWGEVIGLWKPIARGERTNLDRFTAAVVSQMTPPPRVTGIERLPAEPRFLLVANHFQRKGMWILHPAAAITQAVCRHYRGLEPGVRWVVTANWPRWRFGPISMASPGDWILPRVAHALWCYPVPFAGTDPGRTAQSLRRLLRDVRAVREPIGLFPEGVAGVAGKLGAPLEGIDRLLGLLGRAGLPLVPVGIGEQEGLSIRIGTAVAAAEVAAAEDPAALAMGRIADLL